MRNISIPNHLAGIDAIKWVHENQTILKQFKKAQLKQADALSFSGAFVNKDGAIVKAEDVAAGDGVIKKSVVINSCYWYDSHGDVHIPGIWKKSLSEANGIYLLHQHRQSFEDVISDEVKAYTKNISWAALGVDLSGETECLVFDANIEPVSRFTGKETKLYIAYKNGKVKQHSVGMFYVGIELAIKYRGEDWKAENATWDKHINQIANKEEAEDDGMFWAVTQAKVKEGSAVLFGSNIVTPTLEGKGNTDLQPSSDTANQPSDESESDLFKQLLSN